MALIIETGAGVAGADSYQTVTQFRTFVTAYHSVTMPETDTQLESPLRRAAVYMDGIKWNGVRTTGRVQGLAWPRSGVNDCDGTAIGSAEIPAEVAKAQLILAYAEYVTQGILSPSISVMGAIKREKVDVIEIEYDTAFNTGQLSDQRTVVTQAMDILRCFYNSSRYSASAMVV